MKLPKKINIITRLFLICFLLGNSIFLYAQNPFGGGGGGNFGKFGGASTSTPTKANAAKPFKSHATKRDTLHSVVPDSLRSKGNGLETTVNYSAVDSTVLDVTGKVVNLYGNAVVEYGNINLQADYIRLDWDKSEVFAHGSLDTSKASGVKGKPVFTQGAETYNTDTIRYNFKSRKAIIKGIVTQQGDGFVQGAKVKKDADDDMYLMTAKYTTCNLQDPHFYINARRIKLVNKKQIISGSFNFVLNDIPLPIGLPFGFFPIPKKKELGTPGVIIGQYGEEPNGRGFYLRDFGYYIPINEHVGGRVTGEIYSKGSWGVGLNTQYAKKYTYSGNLDFKFNYNTPPVEVPTASTAAASKDFRLSWSHSPQSRRADRSFSASVNLVSNSYNRNNAYLTQTATSSSYLNSAFGSSVQYSRTISKNIRFGTSLRVDQNVSTKILNLGLDYTFGVNSFNPFVPEKKKIGRWYESFRVGLDISGGFTASNDITYQSRSTASYDYKILGVTQQQLTQAELKAQSLGVNTTTKTLTVSSLNDLLTLINNGQFRTTYSVPISLPNFKLGRFINLSPSISYRGEVYTKQLSYSLVPYRKSYLTQTDSKDGLLSSFINNPSYINDVYTNGNAAVKIDTTKGIYNAASYSFGAGLNTRLYGTYQFSGKGRLQAIRHTIIPTLSVNYTPDLSGEFLSKAQVRFVDETVNDIRISRYKYLPKYIGSSTSTAGANGSIGFSLSQQLEAKIRSKSDTAEKEFQKLNLLDNLSLNASYNLIKPTDNTVNYFPLSTISMSASNQILKGLISLNGSASLDPYAYIPDPNEATNNNKAGIRIPTYAVSLNQGLAHLTNVNFGISTRLTPAGFKPKATNQNNPTNDPTREAQLKYIKQNPDLYVDFKMPWNLSVSYNLNYTRNGLAPSLITQALTFQGDVSLTEKWKIGFNTGWDFQFKTATLTSINIHRDLHCWDMAFSWTPIAGSAYRASSFSFDLKPKSALLQELKLSKRRINTYNGGF